MVPSEQSSMPFAEVAVDAPAGPDRTFSYSVPPQIAVKPGQLVRVPFGSRTLRGLVMSLEQAPQVPETRPIKDLVAPEAVLTEPQLELARWVAGHYLCSLFDAASLMLPPGTRVRPKVFITLGDEADAKEDSLTDVQVRLLEYVRPQARVEETRLIDTIGRGARWGLQKLVDSGLLMRSEATERPPPAPKFREYVTLATDPRHDRGTGVAALAPRAPRQAAFLSSLLTVDRPMLLAEARRQYGASPVNAVLDKGLAEKITVQEDRDPLLGREFGDSAPVTLTTDQLKAAAEIQAAMEGDGESGRSFLLWGVTGSGKTEVYLDAVELCMRLGKRAIVLVPEIALTHQTIERFAGRFPGQVAVLHSGLSAGERFDQWWKIKRGEYGVVVGSRGAIFAPQPDLGLIVIDEEHEWTYKQADASPRYHARDVARRLSRLVDAVLVMGSASPDVTTYHGGIRGRHRLLELPDRVTPVGPASGSEVARAPLPVVDVVDMRRELREGNRSMFSRSLQQALREAVEDGGQAILFLNRRGSASYMLCRNCGTSVKCRRCDVALTYHKDRGRLVCHYCGHRRVPPASCSRCLGYRLSFYGFGTQSVAAEVSSLLPEASILRWDRDAQKNAHSYGEFLGRFRNGEAQVLVGTQMIAKGLHFPSVTLVGAVSADMGLNIPDYQAGERVFQLLYQVAGRAGRGSVPGRAIVQSYQPDNYAVRAAAAQDYGAFYRQEIAHRREQGNPPFSRLIRLIYAHTNAALCEREASRWAKMLRGQSAEWGMSDVDVLGPTPAFPARLRGHYRWRITLRGAEPRRVLEAVAVPRGWTVDVDPLGVG